MAHHGPDPKPNKHGRHPNAEWTDVPDVPFGGMSPDLPKLPRRQKWHQMVESWWEQVRRMPHCALWRDVDWTFALETAFMKQAFWRACEENEQTTTAAVEIRRREDQMGTTMEARRKLRIRYVDPETQQAIEVEHGTGGMDASVVSLTSRRARLTG